MVVRSKDLRSSTWEPAAASPRLVLAPNNTQGSMEHRVMAGSTLDRCGAECSRWNGSTVPAGEESGVAFRAAARNYTDTDASDIGQQAHLPFAAFR